MSAPMQSRFWQFAANSWLALWLVLLYLPLAVMMVFSFNDSKRGVVWRGFSLRHYEAALGNETLLEAFVNSLLLGLVTAIISTALGLGAAMALERLRLPLPRLHAGVLVIPLVIPEICLAIALLVFFQAIGWPMDFPWPWSLGTVLAAHVAFSFPFCALVILASLRLIGLEQELAARDLGASPLRAMWDILVPRLKPALLASALLAFTLSLDDFVVTFFTAGPNAQLLPVKIFSLVRFGATPQVNAVSTMLAVVSLLAIVCAARSYKRS